MNGLVVRPGDTLVLPAAPPSRLTIQQRDVMKRAAEAEFPGVKVVIVEGFAGGPFVYRPTIESVDCTCPLIDISTSPNEPEFALGDPAGCRIHGVERDAAIAAAKRRARDAQ